MLEGLIASLLTRLLGEYVEESTFSRESVTVGIWRGARRSLNDLVINSYFGNEAMMDMIWSTRSRTAVWFDEII